MDICNKPSRCCGTSDTLVLFRERAGSNTRKSLSLPVVSPAQTRRCILQQSVSLGLALWHTTFPGGMFVFSLGASAGGRFLIELRVKERGEKEGQRRSPCPRCAVLGLRGPTCRASLEEKAIAPNRLVARLGSE